MAASAPTAIVVEAASKRAFAWAIDWPGWCRSGKTEGDAIEALSAYRDRYAVVASSAGVRFPKSVADRFDVVERVAGNATTEFGAPNVVSESDGRRLSAAQVRRQVALVTACWAVLDDVAGAAPPTLRKGPRGGGRDRDDVVRHVTEAEYSYATKLGIRRRDLGDIPFREAVLAALCREWNGAVARRLAWHVLDHAWEIEDKSE